MVWKISKLRARDILALLIGLYAINYLVTPNLVGPVRLEVYCRPHFSQKFDSKVWKESGVIPDGKHGKQSPSYGNRYPMVDDVLASQLSIGMEEERVRAILGNPDAGILDKKFFLAFRDPYGGNKLNPAKEILESPENIAYWSYHLAYQWQYPAESIWFPKMFFNFDRWILTIKMKNEKVADIKISL